jgi:Fur family transcriptional regulator, zinc uptake regulator
MPRMTAPPSDSDRLAAIELYCRSQGLRLTASRRTVLTLLMRRGHASAYELVADLIQLRGTATPVTVYRALHFLARAGVVRQISTTRMFELCELEQKSPTVMLVCMCCGETVSLQDETLRLLLQNHATLQRYDLDGAHTEVHGRCARCAARNGHD